MSSPNTVVGFNLHAKTDSSQTWKAWSGYNIQFIHILYWKSTQLIVETIETL